MLTAKTDGRGTGITLSKDCDLRRIGSGYGSIPDEDILNLTLARRWDGQMSTLSFR